MIHNLHFTRHFSRSLAITALAIFMILPGLGWGQSYLGLDGGFEGTATIENSTVQTAAQTDKWTKNNASITISDETTIVRSGAHSLSTSNGTTGRRIWTPLLTAANTTSNVTLQVYRRTTSNTTNYIDSQQGIGDGTTTNDLNNTYTSVTNIDTWEKVVYTRSSWTFTNIAGTLWPKLIGTGTLNMYFDDICMYPGSPDNTAPLAPTASVVVTPTLSSLNVSWTAASGGEDGGGYLVVRGTSDPSTTPNVNGIYAVGNTIATGQTVVYQGTGTSFTDNGLAAGTPYYYRIYTYDKAYNYSDALTGTGTTSDAPALTADATNNDVDNNIDITFPDDFAWRNAVTAVKINGTALTASTDYVLSSGNLQLKPSGLNALLTVSGSKSVTVEATDYSVASVTQDINAGAATKLAMKTQPTAPATNGAALAVQPEVFIQDQYGNTTTSTATINATVGAGAWTLGGTTSVSAVAGTTTYSGITATSAAAVTNATISFASGSLTGATSTTFDIPAPPPTITSFTPGSVCTGSTTVVTIIGTNFTGTTDVSFNGTPANIFHLDSDTQITATSPNSFIAGTISVTTPGGTATSTESFTISNGLSSVTITPNSAQAFCATASGTMLTATETGGGAIISRQWGKRSTPGGAITEISGATLQTYTPSGVDLGVGIWYIVCTSSPTCGSAIVSDEVTVTLNAIPSIPEITHTTSLTFCTGGSVLLTSSAGESYLWSTQETSSSITVNTSGSYTVQVTTSDCQSVPSLPTVVTVNPFPSAATAISGPTTVTQGDAGVAYSVGNIADATSYIWEYTPNGDATITGNGKDVTITFSLSASSTGILTVKGHNDCGDGAISADYPIAVDKLYTPGVFTVTGSGTYCSSGSSTFAVSLSGSQLGVKYQLYKNGNAVGDLVQGTGSALDFGIQDAGTYTVTAYNGYTVDMSGSAVIIMDIAPTGTAGPDDNAVVGLPYLLSGASASNYSSLSWSIVSGTGIISDPTLVHPTYTQGTPIGATATLKLTLTNGAVCPVFEDEVVLTMISAGDSKFWIGGTGNWNVATNWSDGIVPSGSSNVFITNNTSKPTITTAAVCNNLDITSGAILTIASGGSLTVAGMLSNSVGTSGLVVQSGGSLIEYSTGVLATVQRAITENKWHFISVPNNSTNSGLFTGKYLQTWSEPTAEWSYITETNILLNPVQGYSLYSNNSNTTYSFTGTLLSGPQSRAITYNNLSSTTNDGANLVGNPYPSYIDWQTLVGTYGAAYYWNGTGYLAYTQPGYSAGSQYVAPMQGFFIVTGSNGTFNLSNTNRAHNPAVTFYKSGTALSNGLVLETVGESYSDKLFVVFDPSATEGFDLPKDAYKFLGYTAGVSELYSYTGDKKLSIDVRPEALVVQLGFTNTLSGEYQIGIDKIADIPAAYLEDTKTNTFRDLLTGAYKFSYTAGEGDKRFLLHFGTTSVKDNEKASATVYSYQKTVYINMTEQAKGNIFIYNMAGQQVATRTSAQGMNEIKLPNTGNYIVKVISRNNTVVRKVFIQ